ncbi:MAG: DMT family transporter, partial [Verrucomicrobiae bacterium]|nr:DMT family transporter [Verrucomicrobiae bacterium]
FFLGQLFNCMALYRGDVSLVTPIMGVKVVFVSVLAVFLLTDEPTAGVWIGAVLSTAAILLLRGSEHADKARVIPSILLGLLSALFFAGFDILVQRYGTKLGFEELVSRMFTFSFLWSLLLVRKFHHNLNEVSRRTWGWLALGGILHSSQAIILAFVLTTYGQAAKVNIFYSSRAFWSIALVWFIGHWFSNYEKHQGHTVFIRRLIGSCLLGVAIVLASL